MFILASTLLQVYFITKHHFWTIAKNLFDVILFFPAVLLVHCFELKGILQTKPLPYLIGFLRYVNDHACQQKKDFWEFLYLQS